MGNKEDDIKSNVRNRLNIERQDLSDVGRKAETISSPLGSQQSEDEQL